MADQELHDLADAFTLGAPQHVGFIYRCVAHKPRVASIVLKSLVQGAEIEEIVREFDTKPFLQFALVMLGPVATSGVDNAIDPGEVLEHASVEELRFRWAQRFLDHVESPLRVWLPRELFLEKSIVTSWWLLPVQSLAPPMRGTTLQPQVDLIRAMRTLPPHRLTHWHPVGKLRRLAVGLVPRGVWAE